jgi:hypothetical protein
LERFFSFRGLSRVSDISIPAEKFDDFLQFYRNELKPKAYTDPGFAGAYLLIDKSGRSADSISLRHFTLWRDSASLHRNNSTHKYQECMKQFAQFLDAKVPDNSNYYLAEFVPGNADLDQLQTKQSEEEDIPSPAEAQADTSKRTPPSNRSRHRGWPPGESGVSYNY